MRDMLYEESAVSNRAVKEAKLYTVFLVFAIVFFVLAAIVAFTFFTIILEAFVQNGGSPLVIVSWILLLALLLGVGVIFWLIKNRFNVSYDYLFVEDELRITKVINGRKRKYLTTIGADKILKIGWCDRDSFEETLRGLNGKKPRIMTPNREPADEKTFYYILVTGSLEKALYVIECRQILLEYLVVAAGRNKLEKQ